MGAKTPEQTSKPITKPRPTVKCDVCGRKFLNVQALKSHHKFLHSKPDLPKRSALRRQEIAKNTKKKIVPVHNLKRVASPVAQEPKKIVEKEKSPDLAGKSVSRKPEFECPVCATRFPVYFTAFRHIQKNHCVDETGAKVAPNSPQLIKPIRIETCASCNKQIRSTELHNCPKQQAHKDQYQCLGCEQVFSGLMLFQHHVKGLHADGAQNYFFPSRTEFTTWKTDLQEHTKVEFIRLNKQKSKEIYHCSHQGPNAQNITYTTKLCPSTITVREYSKGVHVLYYKVHHGHTVQNQPLKKHDQFCIALQVKDTDELKLEADDDNDLYSQFKKMVTNIVLNAAKADVSTIKELLGKALEMATVLKHYQGEDQSMGNQLVSKSLTDAEISMTLDTLKPNQGKRKLSPDKESKKVEAKKVKKALPIAKSLENGVTTRRSRSSPALNKSVTFNKTISKKNEEELEKSLSKNEEVQTKNVKKKTEEPSQKAASKADEVFDKKVEEPVAPVTPLPRSLIQSPTSFNESYKNFVDQNFKTQTETSTPKAKSTVKKKEVIRTKMGQFKAKSISPKNMSPKSPKVKEVKKDEPPVTSITWKVKPDIRYEVKEQENDCNILILKI